MPGALRQDGTGRNAPSCLVRHRESPGPAWSAPMRRMASKALCLMTSSRVIRAVVRAITIHHRFVVGSLDGLGRPPAVFPLRQLHHPMEEVNHVLVGSQQGRGAVEGAEESARLLNQLYSW